MLEIFVCIKICMHTIIMSLALQVERLEIGALVLIRGVGRVKILELKEVSDLSIWISFL